MNNFDQISLSVGYHKKMISAQHRFKPAQCFYVKLRTKELSYFWPFRTKFWTLVYDLDVFCSLKDCLCILIIMLWTHFLECNKNCACRRILVFLFIKKVKFSHHTLHCDLWVHADLSTKKAFLLSDILG